MTSTPSFPFSSTIDSKKNLRFGVIGLNHGHIFAMVDGLLKTGRAECAGYFAKEPALQAQMKKVYPKVPLVTEEEELLRDPSIQLICSASINRERAGLAVRAMRAGKDVFVDKPAVTALPQLDEIEKVQKETGRLWIVFYGERLGDPTSTKAIELVKSGAIGRLVNFIGLGPHKLSRPTRPDWMFVPEKYGGILNDIAIHQVEIYTHLAGGKVLPVSSRIGNYHHPDVPGFEDFGDATFAGPDGSTAYVRVDWHTPDPMPTFGDIRNFIIGTKGMIELRKTVDLGVDNSRFTGHQLILATFDQPPHRIPCESEPSKYAAYDRILDDLRDRKNRVAPHDISFAACRATLEAQGQARRVSL